MFVREQQADEASRSPGDPDGYPGRDEVVDYLESYAATFELPVQLNSAVQSVASGDDGGP